MATGSKFTLPTSQQHISIYGQNGCGKSQQAVWFLSQATIETRPHVIIDYKRDELINSIPYANYIDYNDSPKHPGVYILHPNPGEDEAVEKFLWKIYERGNTGIYVDEGFMMPKPPRFKAYPALLVQGRSKHIPIISLTQKPFYCPMQVLSEPQYHSVFFLADDNDKKRIREFTTFTREELDRELPEFHSYLYRVKDRAKFGLRPVPDADSLREIFARRLAPKRKLL